jgi:hypothetical protein
MNRALLLGLVVMAGGEYCFAQTIAWTRQFGSPSVAGNDTIDIGQAVAADSIGSVYVAGYTEGTLPGQTSLGPYDAFIRKYDSSGAEKWTRQFGTQASDFVYGIVIDNIGNIYVAGYTQGTFPHTSSLGQEDAYIRKYNPNGDELWTRQFGTAGTDVALATAVDATGNVYAAGVTLGLGGLDAFLRKFDGNGATVWTRQFGTAARDSAQAVVTDLRGDVYVTGYTYGKFPGQSNAGRADAFLRKYDPNGTPLWTHQFGTPGDDIAKFDRRGYCRWYLRRRLAAAPLGSGRRVRAKVRRHSHRTLDP